MTYTDRDFNDNIAQEKYSNIKRWEKMGWSPLVNATESDIWAASGVYVFPTAAMGMEVLSSDANDTGTVIKGNAQGATAIKCDVGGTTTTLNDADVDFLAATAVAVGDCVLLDPCGTSPEWGYVTAVATNTLTIGLGFSLGGSCATARSYSVIDTSATTGAHVFKCEYLDGNYAQKNEIIILNGTNVVPTVNTDIFRSNSSRIIAAGSGLKPAGNITLRHLADTPIYGYIGAGFTRGRQSLYTVPAGKTLYMQTANASFGLTGVNKVEYCRILLQSNLELQTMFRTDGLMSQFAEICLGNGAIHMDLPVPIKLKEKTDIKASAIASAEGVATCVMRGYITTP